MTTGGTRVAAGDGAPGFSLIPREPPVYDPPDPSATRTIIALIPVGGVRSSRESLADLHSQTR
jgi:hypothetical protein